MPNQMAEKYMHTAKSKEHSYVCMLIQKVPHGIQLQMEP